MRSGKSYATPRLAGMLGLALTLSACGGSSGGVAADSIAEMEHITLSFQSQASPEHPQGVAQKAFADEVAKATDGKVEVEVYYSGSLLAGDADLSGLTTGVADIGVIFATYHPQTLPVANWFMKTQSLRSDTTPHGFIQASAALQKMVTTSEVFQQEADEHNAVFLGISSGATNVGLLCKEPLTTPEDADGARVRVGGPLWADEVSAAGFTPVSIPISEAYEGLQRGVIDCQMADPTTVASLGFWDVAKYYHPVAGSGTSSTVMAINKDTWENLPDEVQEIMRDATDNYNARVLEAGLSGYKEFAEQMDEKGVTIVDSRQLNELITAHQQRIVEDELVDSAPAAVTDPEAFLEAWRSSLEWGMDLAIENVGAEPQEADMPEAIRNSYLTGADAVDVPKFLAALRAER